MHQSVNDLIALIARSGLLSREEVQALSQRWNRKGRPGIEDVQQFSSWVVDRKFLTQFQLDLLVRKGPQHLFLNDYKLLDGLGQGRMAAVFRAIHPCGQMVAIKVLPPSKTRDPQVFGRFQREARLALRLKHPNIVRTFQKGEARGLHFIVMEYLEGETLEELVKRRGRLPPAEAVRLVYQVLHGLQHIHDNGMVHRDLKPGNLMLVRPGEPGQPDNTLRSTVKILDIGLGRALFDENATQEEADPGVNLTLPTQSLGVPAYMAPEQARDAHSADIRADVYTLGCVLYETLTGRLPFADRSAMELVLRPADATPPPARQFNNAVPRPLDEVLLRMLATDPARRFSTPREAAQALEPLLTQREAPAQEVPASTRKYLEWLDQLPREEAEDEPAPRPAKKPAGQERVAPALPRVKATKTRPSESSTAEASTTGTRAGSQDSAAPVRPAKPRDRRSPVAFLQGLGKWHRRPEVLAVLGGLLLAVGIAVGILVNNAVHGPEKVSQGPGPTHPEAPPELGGPGRPPAPADGVKKTEPAPPLGGTDAARLCAVPSLKGQRVDLALQVLRLTELQGLAGVFYIAPDSWRDDIDADVVFMQSPQPKTLVPEGSMVPCWTFARAAANQQVVKVPDLRGLSRSEASTRLQKLGLPVLEGKADGPENLRKVADQYPRPGQSVFEGTSVFLQNERQ